MRTSLCVYKIVCTYIHNYLRNMSKKTKWKAKHKNPGQKKRGKTKTRRKKKKKKKNSKRWILWHTSKVVFPKLFFSSFSHTDTLKFNNDLQVELPRSNKFPVSLSNTTTTCNPLLPYQLKCQLNSKTDFMIHVYIYNF